MLTKLTILSWMFLNNSPMNIQVESVPNLISGNETNKIIVNQQTDTIELPDFEIRDSAVLQYYTLINAAEASILDSNFVEAMDHYLNAFRIKYPYWRDIRNAKAVLKFADTKDSLLRKQYLELTRPFRADNPITQQIDSMFRLEQDARMNAKEKIGSQDSANHQFLLSVLKDNPISEQSIGINCMTHLETILLHLSRYAHFSELIPILADQVSSGNFSNRSFANLVDGYYGYHVKKSKTDSPYLTQSIYPIFSKFLLPTLEPELTQQIDKRRAAIGLEGIQDQYRKQFYNFKHGYREFEFYQFFTWFPAEEYCTEEEKISYLEREKTMVIEFMDKEKNLIIWTK